MGDKMKKLSIKVDLKKSDKPYYSGTNSPALQTFPPIPYISLQGKGSPDSEGFDKAIQELYTLAYTIKKICKSALHDFVVPPLEGQWWVTGTNKPLETSRDEWHWNLLIRMPANVNEKICNEAKKIAEKKRGLPLSQILFSSIQEGPSVQIMHTGPYKDEWKTLEKIYQYMEEKKITFNGHHHEIYLSDPRKTSPEKLKTILRQPVKNL